MLFSEQKLQTGVLVTSMWRLGVTSSLHSLSEERVENEIK
jgi:hypothetical protein